MRKIALLLCALGLLYVGHTQTTFGLKAGLNVSTVTALDGGIRKWHSGFHAGALARVSLPGKLFIQPELLYSLKGYAVEADQYNPKGLVDFHYISLPLLAGFQATNDLSVAVGPELGYMISARSRFDGTTHDISQNFEDFDYGIDLGVAYRVNEKLGIDLRYNHGLRKLVNGSMTDQNGQITAEWQGVSNRVFQVGVQYSFAGR